METKFKPNYAIHPGEFVKDEMEEVGITQKNLAKKIGVSTTIINEVVKGKRRINGDLAVRLEMALLSPASVWLNLQARYDETVARIKLESQKNSETACGDNSFEIIINDIHFENGRNYYSYHVSQKYEGVA